MELFKITEYLKNLEDEDDYYTDSFKIQTVKLFIEVEEYAEPIGMLENLLKENAKNAEVLYLISFCNWKLKNYYHALEFIEGCFALDLSDDDELRTAAVELKDELDKSNFNEAKDGEDYMKDNKI